MPKVRKLLMPHSRTYWRYCVPLPVGTLLREGLTPRIQQSQTESNGRIYRGDTMELSSTTPASATRITRAFEQARREGRGVLIPYFMCGYPSATQSIELVLAGAKGGADIIELGMPFSDPIPSRAPIPAARTC